jgi:hypothetical protein
MALLALESWDISGSVRWNGTPLITATGRTGVNAMQQQNNGNTFYFNYYKDVITSSTAIYYAGFAFKRNPGQAQYTSTTGPGHFSWGPAGSASRGINITSTGIGLRDIGVNGYTAFTSWGNPDSTWMYVEIEFQPAVAGYVKVYVDNVLRFDYAGNASCDWLPATVGWGDTDTATPYFVDDFYLCDNTGTTNNTRKGNVQINALRPTVDGNYQQFTPSTGTSHFALVDEVPFSGTDYNTGSTGQKDSYDVTSIDASRVIHGISYTSRIGTESGTNSLGRNFVRIGPTDYPGASQTIGSTGAVRDEIVELSPATSVAWTGAEINAAEFGYEAL